MILWRNSLFNIIWLVTISIYKAMKNAILLGLATAFIYGWESNKSLQGAGRVLPNLLISQVNKFSLILLFPQVMENQMTGVLDVQFTRIQVTPSMVIWVPVILVRSSSPEPMEVDEHQEAEEPSRLVASKSTAFGWYCSTDGNTPMMIFYLIERFFI